MSKSSRYSGQDRPPRDQMKTIVGYPARLTRAHRRAVGMWSAPILPLRLERFMHSSARRRRKALMSNERR